MLMNSAISNRNRWRNAWIWQALCVSLLWVTVASAATSDAESGSSFFDSTAGHLKEELATAKAEGKKGILLVFEMDGCPYCEHMRTTVLNQAAVQGYFRTYFRIFTINLKGDVEITDFSGAPVTEKEFAAQLGIRMTPTFAFFDLDGNRLTRFTGATDDAEEFMWLGNYVVEGHYNDVPFKQYQHERQESLEQR